MVSCVRSGQTRGLNAFEKAIAKKNGQGNRLVVGKFKGRFRVIENSMLKYVEDPINLKVSYASMPVNMLCS